MATKTYRSHGQDIYSDEYLRETLENASPMMRGLIAEAEILLSVPYEARHAIWRDANYMRNMTSNVWSYCLQSAKRAWERGELS